MSTHGSVFGWPPQVGCPALRVQATCKRCNCCWTSALTWISPAMMEQWPKEVRDRRKGGSSLVKDEAGDKKMLVKYTRIQDRYGQIMINPGLLKNHRCHRQIMGCPERFMQILQQEMIQICIFWLLSPALGGSVLLRAVQRQVLCELVQLLVAGRARLEIPGCRWEWHGMAAAV